MGCLTLDAKCLIFLPFLDYFPNSFWYMVKWAGSGICLCEMLGLKIEVGDTLGFRIRMGRKKGGLLVEIVKHQGKIISLGLRKLTTKYALCLHVQHIYMKITIQWDLVRCASSFWAGLSPPKNNRVPDGQENQLNINKQFPHLDIDLSTFYSCGCVLIASFGSQSSWTGCGTSYISSPALLVVVVVFQHPRQTRSVTPLVCFPWF